MRSQGRCARTSLHHALAGVLTVSAVLLVPCLTWAVEPSDVVRVEEDWELVVEAPEPTTAAPQVTCVISPLADLDSWYVAFELNHQTLPEFAAGGLVLQAWQGDLPGNAAGQKFGSVLNHNGEHITWTQGMSLSDGTLTFEVIDGESTTWGSFGGGGQLQVTAATSLDNLNAYSPEISVANSGVGFASNRVQQLELKKVRVFRANGDIQELNVDLTVHELE